MLSNQDTKTTLKGKQSTLSPTKQLSSTEPNPNLSSAQTSTVHNTNLDSMSSNQDTKTTLEGKQSTLSPTKQLSSTEPNPTPSSAQAQPNLSTENMFKNMNLSFPPALSGTTVINTYPDGSCLLQCITTHVHKACTKDLVLKIAEKVQAHVITNFDKIYKN